MKIEEEDLIRLKEEYQKKRPFLDRLNERTKGLIKDALTETPIQAFEIQSRVKEFDSFIDKVLEKIYEEPFKDVTDLIGIRIIVYLEKDIDEIHGILGAIFEVDAEDTTDKRIPDNTNEVGYRSLHLICRLGEERSTLPEYREIFEIPFEIQIRTALQHTWAEIEHKRNYKSSAPLPPDLERRLFVVSGTLELIDRELSDITEKATRLKEKLINNDPECASRKIDTFSLALLANHYSERFGLNIQEYQYRKGLLDDLLAESKMFGIETVQDLRALLEKPRILEKYRPNTKNIADLLRNAMILENPRHYLEHAYRPKVYQFTERDTDLLRDALGEDFEQELEKQDLHILKES